jgi:hypothetical protein
MWLIAAVFFFIPQGLAVTELSSRFPKEGGIYFWTKRALGEGHGFLRGGKYCEWGEGVEYGRREPVPPPDFPSVRTHKLDVGLR